MSSPCAFLSVQEHPHQIISKIKCTPQQQLHVAQPPLDTQSKFLPTQSLSVRIPGQDKGAAFKRFRLGTQLWAPKA